MNEIKLAFLNSSKIIAGTMKHTETAKKIQFTPAQVCIKIPSVIGNIR